MHLFVAKYEDGTTKILYNLADCEGEAFIEGHWIEQEKMTVGSSKDNVQDDITHQAS